MSASPEKSRAVGHTEESDEMRDESLETGPVAANKRKKKSLKQYVTQTEVWSLMVSILMQDGPYLGVRLYAVIELGIINSTIFFFVLKNSIVILLLAYRLIVVGLLLSEDNDNDNTQMFKPPVNHTTQKPKLPTNGVVSTPEVRRRSGANN
ncbi:transmembrane protein 26, partial [Elysia marginata]